MINKDFIQLNIRYCINDQKNFNQNILTLLFLFSFIEPFSYKEF